jgi:hypothetical protein
MTRIFGRIPFAHPRRPFAATSRGARPRPIVGRLGTWVTVRRFRATPRPRTDL